MNTNTYEIDTREIYKQKHKISTKSAHYWKGYYYILASEYKLSNSSKFLAKFKENKNDNELSFINFLNINTPENYVKFKFADTFQQLIFNRNIAAYPVGDIIFDIETGDVYKIPLPNSEFASVEGIMTKMINGERPSSFYMYDIRDAGQYIEMLYRNVNDDFVFMKFNKIDPTKNIKYTLSSTPKCNNRYKD